MIGAETTDGAAIFEGPIPGFDDPAVDFGGKPSSAAIEPLDAIADGLGIPKLGDFLGMSRWAAMFADEGLDKPNRPAFEMGDVFEDLSVLESMLQTAEPTSVRFYLSADR